jgi:hypothetical protein
MENLKKILKRNTAQRPILVQPSPQWKYHNTAKTWAIFSFTHLGLIGPKHAASCSSQIDGCARLS